MNTAPSPFCDPVFFDWPNTRVSVRWGYDRIRSAPGYGGYMIVNADDSTVVNGATPGAYSLSREAVADWLESI